MPRKKARRTSRRNKTFAVIPFAAKFNAIVQVVEPYLSRTPELIAAAQAKDLAGFIGHMRAANKELVSVANLIEAGGPLLGLAVLKWARSRMSIPNPSLGPVRAF